MEDNFNSFMPLFEALLKAPYANGPVARLLNPKRLREVMDAKLLLEQLLLQSDENPKVIMDLKPDFGAISLKMDVDSLEVRELSRLSKALSNASNIEFYPLTNGKLSIDIMFYHAFSTLQ